MTIPQHFSNSTSRSVAGAAIFLGGPVLLLSQQFTGSLALAMHSALLSDVHYLCLVACVPWTTSSSCSTVQGTWSHWCASALRSLSVPHPGHVGISLGSPPSAVRRWFSREAIPLDRDLRLRLAAMASDLHGVRVDVSSDNFLPARENPVYSFNLPPSAVRLWGLARWGHDLSSTGRPSRHRLGPSSCPFCNDVDGSLVHHLSSCPAGLILAASHRPTYLRLHGTVGCSTPSTSRTRRRQSGSTFALSGSSANGSNHSLGNASLLRSLVLHPGHSAQPVRRPTYLLNL